MAKAPCSKSQHLHFHRDQGEALTVLTLAVLVVGLNGRCLCQGFLQAKSTAFEVAGEEALLGRWDTGVLYDKWYDYEYDYEYDYDYQS